MSCQNIQQIFDNIQIKKGMKFIMKTKSIKEFSAILLIFTMIFTGVGFDFLVSNIVNAQEINNGEPSSIKVRVEGFDKTLYNEEIEYGFNSETHPLDVLKAAVGEENIDGTQDPSMEYFITEILGEGQGSNQGWCYYVKDNSGNIIFPSIGPDQFDGLTNLNNELIADEIVFYICSYSGQNLATKIPVVTVEKDEANFKIKVVDHKVGNEPIKNVAVKVETEGTYQTNEKGEVSFVLNKAGTYHVEISKDIDYPQIVRQHLILESEGSSTDEVENVIKELKQSYGDKDEKELKAIEVMAYNSLMNDKNDYKISFKLNTSENAAAYAENIMGCLATGQDVSSYVDKLVNAQNEEGKFVIGKNDEKSVTALADVITALDMAKASYNTESAVTALVNSANSGHYEDVTTTAYALRALLNHKDIAEVEGLITASIAYLKRQQLDNGGYDYYSMGNSPYVTGPVLQALVLAKEDLSSDEWKKGDKTLVAALLACKLDDGTFQSSETMRWDMSDPGATQFAFAALSDVYSQKSMYERFSAEDLGSEKNYGELIDNAIDGIKDYLTSMETRMDASYQSHPAFYRTLEVIGLNCTSKDIQADVEDLAGKFNINEHAGTLPYVLNIIGLKASGQNPQEYVELLKAGQQEDGSFKIGKVEQTESAVIALDMVGADYSVKKAVQRVMDRNNTKEDVSLLSIAITALAPHKDIEGVETFINTKLEYIKSKQLETGGFEMMDMMSGESVESSIPTAYVISALVANGIDPLTEQEWIKGENTLLDSLLKFKKLNYFLCNNGQYAEYFYKDEATEQAFIALADLKNKKSAYQNVKDAVSYKGLVKDSLFKLRNYLITTENRKNTSLEDIPVYYSWQEALAINYTSDDLDNVYKDIQAKLKLDNKDTVFSYAQDIIGIIASGQNPKDFDGENYVQNLINLQNQQGEFKEETKDTNVYKQSYAIIALDMAQIEYDKEKR